MVVELHKTVNHIAGYGMLQLLAAGKIVERGILHIVKHTENSGFAVARIAAIGRIAAVRLVCILSASAHYSGRHQDSKQKCKILLHRLFSPLQHVIFIAAHTANLYKNKSI